ncbi:ATP-dependent helicase [Armatimonas rosea]|uniref:DNA 3'-5' helicase n=1 Tax=Armatimonas rosea TaxID=685828 RepID=A0A7W9SVY5_ARMRO|nr:ATP-dependent helicase [Armatimonas rosea]MBB6053199.1 DNA helicase-2/ATP-dependent DNA helicase PcrA [Armatimonas rosea]
MSDSPLPSPTPKSIDLDELSAGLNAQQFEAYAHTKGAALVLAGAGSGKTTVLIRRIARLIAEGVPPEKILVTTFTRRAADDMSERLVKLLGEEAVVGLWIGTFHSHCLRILKKEWAERFGKEGRFDLADEYWQKRVCRAILGKMGDYKSLPQPPFGQNMKLDPKLALLAISTAKNSGFDCEQGETALTKIYPDWEEPQVHSVAKFWRCYEQAKQKEFDVLSKVPARRLDFDDLLVEALYLLRDDKKAQEEYLSKFDYLLVDETQDTSEVQWQLARLLAKKHGNLFIVGDVGQSIYGFRGCDPKRTVMGFQASYPNGEIIRLPANYRSQGTVVTVANELIAHADLDDRYRLLMEPTRLSAQEPWLSQHLDAEAEALWVVERLREQLSTEPNMAFRDFALLYRTNAYSRCFEDALINAGIPYQITGGTSFYNRKEVKDLLAYLQLSVDPNSEAGTEACKRILNIASKKFGRPTRSLGMGFIKKVEEQAEKNKCSFYEMLKKGVYTTQQEVAILDFRKQIKEIHEAGETAQTRLMAARLSGYDDFIVNEDGDSEDEGEGSSRLDNLDELVAASQRFFAPEAMLTFVGGQIRKAKDAGKGQDAVNLMTVHKSKGLEWRCVFVVGFAMNLLPHHRSLRYVDGELLPDSLEEERRIAYVAITRAKEQFALSWPQYHNAKALGPSPFLIEMPTLAPLVDDALRSQHKEDDDAQALADEEFEE